MVPYAAEKRQERAMPSFSSPAHGKPLMVRSSCWLPSERQSAREAGPSPVTLTTICEEVEDGEEDDEQSVQGVPTFAKEILSTLERRGDTDTKASRGKRNDKGGTVEEKGKEPPTALSLESITGGTAPSTLPCREGGGAAQEWEFFWSSVPFALHSTPEELPKKCIPTKDPLCGGPVVDDRPTSRIPHAPAGSSLSSASLCRLSPFIRSSEKKIEKQKSQEKGEMKRKAIEKEENQFRSSKKKSEMTCKRNISFTACRVDSVGKETQKYEMKIERIEEPIKEKRNRGLACGRTPSPREEEKGSACPRDLEREQVAAPRTRWEGQREKTATVDGVRMEYVKRPGGAPLNISHLSSSSTTNAIPARINKMYKRPETEEKERVVAESATVGGHGVEDGEPEKKANPAPAASQGTKEATTIPLTDHEGSPLSPATCTVWCDPQNGMPPLSPTTGPQKGAAAPMSLKETVTFSCSMCTTETNQWDGEDARREKRDVEEGEENPLGTPLFGYCAGPPSTPFTSGPPHRPPPHPVKTRTAAPETLQMKVVILPSGSVCQVPSFSSSTPVRKTRCTCSSSCVSSSSGSGPLEWVHPLPPMVPFGENGSEGAHAGEATKWGAAQPSPPPVPLETETGSHVKLAEQTEESPTLLHGLFPSQGEQHHATGFTDGSREVVLHSIFERIHQLLRKERALLQHTRGRSPASASTVGWCEERKVGIVSHPHHVDHTEEEEHRSVRIPHLQASETLAIPFPKAPAGMPHEHPPRGPPRRSRRPSGCPGCMRASSSWERNEPYVVRSANGSFIFPFHREGHHTAAPHVPVYSRRRRAWGGDPTSEKESRGQGRGVARLAVSPFLRTSRSSRKVDAEAGVPSTSIEGVVPVPPVTWPSVSPSCTATAVWPHTGKKIPQDGEKEEEARQWLVVSAAPPIAHHATSSSPSSDRAIAPILHSSSCSHPEGAPLRPSVGVCPAVEESAYGGLSLEDIPAIDLERKVHTAKAMDRVPTPPLVQEDISEKAGHAEKGKDREKAQKSSPVTPPNTRQEEEHHKKPVVTSPSKREEVCRALSPVTPNPSVPEDHAAQTERKQAPTITASPLPVPQSMTAEAQKRDIENEWEDKERKEVTTSEERREACVGAEATAPHTPTETVRNGIHGSSAGDDCMEDHLVYPFPSMTSTLVDMDLAAVAEGPPLLVSPLRTVPMPSASASTVNHGMSIKVHHGTDHYPIGWKRRKDQEGTLEEPRRKKHKKKKRSKKVKKDEIVDEKEEDISPLQKTNDPSQKRIAAWAPQSPSFRRASPPLPSSSSSSVRCCGAAAESDMFYKGLLPYFQYRRHPFLSWLSFSERKRKEHARTDLSARSHHRSVQKKRRETKEEKTSQEVAIPGNGTPPSPLISWLDCTPYNRPRYIPPAPALPTGTSVRWMASYRSLSVGDISCWTFEGGGGGSEEENTHEQQ